MTFAAASASIRPMYFGRSTSFCPRCQKSSRAPRIWPF
ncbi:hypothetical protein E5J99_05290 [Hymenobacter elongatus]|uniref:Uncharacterized protein n=1 Tax=Hymenobacter elongatus TaxID=877208 RepID=A0A4Z0PPV7_9BACT|nr:hypothetical protein E5J99_05290 [Hymenobacter elongatus]